MTSELGTVRVDGGKYAIAIALTESVRNQKKRPLALTNETGEIRRGGKVYEKLGVIVHKFEPLDDKAEAFEFDFTIHTAKESSRAFPLKGRRFSAIYNADSGELRAFES
jgi:hypothetical protein